MTRTKAASSHLLLSIVIFSVMMTILLFFWFPSPYFTATGGWQGLKIVAGVDLVLGPLLTLIIFDSKKSTKALAGDITLIALIQFTALAWGINTIYQQRPVAVVFWENDFITVPAVELTNQNISLDELDKFGDQRPVVVYAEKPTTLEGLKEMSKKVTEQAVAPHNQIGLYKSLNNHYSDIKPLQVNINEIITANTKMNADLMTILDETDSTIEDYDYFPLRSKYHNIILLFSHDGQLQNHIVVKK